MAASVLEWTLIANDRASDKFKHAGSNMDRLGRTFKRVAQVGAVALAGLAVAALKFGADSVKAAADAEKQQQRLAFAWEKSAKTSDVLLSSIRDLNTELQKTTKYDDDLIASAQGVLTNFNLTGRQIEQLTPLMLDYASRTGKDLPTAAQDLGKALLGQGRALKAIGINFKDTGSAAGNFEALVSALQSKVGGFAAGEANTLDGKLQILKHRFGEIKETVGRALIDPLLKLAGFIDTTVMPRLETMATWFADHAPAAFSALAPYASQLSDTFGKLGEAFSDPKVADALYKLVTEALPALTDLIVALTPLIPPLASVISAVLVPAIGILTKDVTGLNALFSGNLDTMRSWLRGVLAMPGPIGGAFRTIVTSTIGVVNFLIDGANRLTQALEGVVNAFTWLTGVHINIRDIPRVSLASTLFGNEKTATSVQTRTGGSGGVNAGMFAAGGIITKPTLAMMGEGGEPEGVFPLSKAKNFGFGSGGGGISVTFTGPVYGANAAELGRQVTDSIVRGVNSGQWSAVPLQRALGIS